MALEDAQFIHQFVVTNPVGATDNKAQGDDHIRMMKAAIINTFPNVEGVVNSTHTEINRLIGVTGDIEPMRGMGFSVHAAPYQIAQVDIGTAVLINNSGLITLPNLADNFACLIMADNGNLTITSSSGVLAWYSGAGINRLEGNRTLLNSGVICVHRLGGHWRTYGAGLT